ncbi:MAG: hypothetical protein ACXWEY_05990 [Bacteroidia bacterium]
MKNLLKTILFLITGSVIASCNRKTEMYENIEKYYLENKQCTDDNSCTFAIKDITNFEWDTMKLRENDAGIYWEFNHRGKVVHSYFKEGWKDWSNPHGIEFGIFHDTLYAKVDCLFKLKAEQKNTITKDYIFYILPLDSRK